MDRNNIIYDLSKLTEKYRQALQLLLEGVDDLERLHGEVLKDQKLTDIEEIEGSET